MANWTKIIVGTVVTGALIGGTVYLSQLNHTSAELESVPRAQIHKLDFSGLVIRVDVQLKNPTRTALKIKFPFIKLLYKGNTIGSSQVIDRDITIPAFGEAVVDQIMINVPLTSLFSLSGKLIQAVQNNESVKLTVSVLSSIDLGWKKVAYSTSEEISIRKKA